MQPGRLFVRLVAVSAVVIAGALAFDWYEDLDDADGRFPPRIVQTEVVKELGFPLEPQAVVRQRADDPVRVERLEPSGYRGGRRALVAPAPAEVRLNLDVPQDAALRVGLGAQLAGEPGRPAPTRFSITLDGRTVYTRVLDPGTDRRARRWLDEQLSLEEFAGREVTIGLVTEPVDGVAPADGVRPGWARLQVVRETRRERQQVHPDAPHVLLLLVDALRADALGCYGASPSPSPVLDALAGRGVVFEQAIAQAPWTLPSVASIMTGLHPRSHGVMGRSLAAEVAAAADPTADVGFLSDGLATIASEAARAGITTFGVSSNPLISLENNLARGFERFVVLRSDWEGSQWARAGHVHESFLRWAGRNRDRRFFAYLHYMEPHDPYVPDPAWAPADDPGLPADARAGLVRNLAEAIERGAPLLPPTVLGHLRARYAGAVRAWDRALGELLEGLADLGLDRNTILVVTADHGEEFQEHGHLGHRRQLYDESLHVPLLVVGPGVAAGRRPEQVEGIDVFPTLARLLGVTAPPGLPGRDVLAGPLAERLAFVETQYGVAGGTTNVELLAARRATAKLVWAPALEHRELYDLRDDPGERVNRWPAAAGATLAESLAAHRAAAPPAPQASGSDPALEEKLRALGYVR